MVDLPAGLARIPLFEGVTDAHLAELCAVLERRALAEGERLFSAGEIPERFHVLVEGELELGDGGAGQIRLRPPAPVGELAALVGMPRTMTAVAGPGCVVLELEVARLMQFFEEHGDVGFPVHHNLLRLVADKLRRDQRRLDEMRENLITTQKAMKRMRDALLESEDTPLHGSLFEELDSLIEQNKKGHYLVEPTRALPARTRADDGAEVEVLALSNEWLHLAPHPGPRAGGEWSAVLVLGDTELVVSGKVEQTTPERVIVDLDPLIDELAGQLEAHLTRLQMLDVVV